MAKWTQPGTLELHPPSICAPLYAQLSIVVPIWAKPIIVMKSASRKLSAKDSQFPRSLPGSLLQEDGMGRNPGYC